MSNKRNKISSDETIKNRSFIPAVATPEQAKDTGMALVLVCLLIYLWSGVREFTIAAVLFLLVDMIRPTVYKPAARIWFGFANLIGTVMSKVILTIIFFILVTPVGLIRKAMGKDSLRLHEWKKGSRSVFRIRNAKVTENDIVNPY